MLKGDWYFDFMVGFCVGEFVFLHWGLLVLLIGCCNVTPVAVFAEFCLVSLL